MIKQIILKSSKSALFKDSFWALLGSVLGKGLALIAGIAVARFLGNESYGEYGMIRNNLTMISIFSTLGLGYTATKFIAECKSDKKQVYCIHKIVSNITFVFSGLIAILFAVFSKEIAIWLEVPNHWNLLCLSSAAIILNAVNTTQIGELSGLNAYKTITKNNLWSGLATFFLSILLTYFFSLFGSVIALLLSLSFNCVINRFSLITYIDKSSNVTKRKSSMHYKKIVKFSLPIALQESSYSIISWLGTVIMIKFAGYGELGIYSVAVQWLAVLLFIPGALRNVALSHLAESNNDINVNKAILKRMSLVNLTATLIPAIVICFLSSWICALYGDSYDGLQLVLNICIFSSVVNALLNALTQNLIALNQNWFMLLFKIFKDTLTLVSCIVMIQIGVRGAMAFVISNLSFSFVYLIVLALRQRAIYKCWNISNY